jgi:hypothetical protein
MTIDNITPDQATKASNGELALLWRANAEQAADTITQLIVIRDELRRRGVKFPPIKAPHSEAFLADTQSLLSEALELVLPGEQADVIQR